jgi:hypothetical protein
MTIPLYLLDTMVYTALTVSAIGPVLLLYLLYRDWKKGCLW